MNNLRKCRKELGLTTVQLGKIVGVSDAAISMYETGKREPTIDMYARFAELYGKSIDYLAGHAEAQAVSIEKQPAPKSWLDAQADMLMSQLSEADKVAICQQMSKLIAAHK